MPQHRQPTDYSGAFTLQNPKTNYSLPHTGLYNEAVTLLEQLIALPSFSRSEAKTADLLFRFLESKGVAAIRKGNNVWAYNKHFNPAKPVLLLNSHHDTVKPNTGYTRNPFEPVTENGALYGLGSNDAGASLVCLLAAFLHYYEAEMPVNIVFLASAEEEISGSGGVEAVLPELPVPHLALVGEPTGMRLATAEKGLLVLDCTATGVAGHAARNEGVNALYAALPDLEWFRTYTFEKISPALGPVKMQVTAIKAGEQHNVVPDTCTFTVDIRVTDSYTHQQILDTVKAHVSCHLQPRSIRLQSSHTPAGHPVLQAAQTLGLECFGSPTLSDQALMPFPSVKIGPGQSARSHAPDEYILLSEIEEAIEIYIQLIAETYQL